MCKILYFALKIIFSFLSEMFFDFYVLDHCSFRKLQCPDTHIVNACAYTHTHTTLSSATTRTVLCHPLSVVGFSHPTCSWEPTILSFNFSFFLWFDQIRGPLWAFCTLYMFAVIKVWVSPKLKLNVNVASYPVVHSGNLKMKSLFYFFQLFPSRVCSFKSKDVCREKEMSIYALFLTSCNLK